VKAGSSSPLIELDILTFIYRSDGRTYSEVALPTLFMLVVVDEVPRPVSSVFMPVDDILGAIPTGTARTLAMTVKGITKKVEALMAFIFKGQIIYVEYRVCCLGVGPGEDFYIINEDLSSLNPQRRLTKKFI